MFNRREFLKTGTALGAAVTTHPAQSALSAERGDWFMKNPRVYLLDFQMPDPADQHEPGMPREFFQKLDVRKIVDQVAAANLDTLLIHAKCNQGNAYYNTKVGHKHSSLGDIDLMRETSRYCRERGLNLLYYVQLSRERRSSTYPERQALNAKGEHVNMLTDNPMLASKLEKPVACLNGPHRQYIKDILEELSAGYDFDGFWLDCFSWWGRTLPCFCKACKDSYRNDTGNEIPKGALTSKAGRNYMAWRRALNTKILHELIDCIRTTNPKLSVTHNGSGFHNAFDWEFCDSDDYVCREFHFNEGPGNLSLTCRKNWALKPGKPYEIELWRFANRLGGSNRTFRAYQVRPADTLLMEMGATVAHGGFPQYYDQIRPDGELDVRSMERVTAAFAKGKVRQRWRGVGEPVPYAAILWSKATDAFAPGASKKMHIDGLTGVHHAFMESHLPVHLVTEREVEQGDFRGAKVVVLPSTECLSEECVKGLKAFVNNGGGLVVMGRSSMRDGKGNALKNFALADVLGVNYDGMTKKWYGYLNFESRHASNRKLPINFPISVNETLQVKVKAGRGTKVLGTIVEPMYGFHMGFPPDKRTGVPGMTVRETGKGRVVYFGSDQGAVYRGFNHADNRQLIVSAVTWAAGEQSPITAKAPETVEVVPWRDEENKRTVVHLVNKTGAGLAQGDGGMMHETIPVHDLTLRVAGPLAGKRAALQPAQRELPVSWEGTTMVISIDKLDVWEVVEIS